VFRPYGPRGEGRDDGVSVPLQPPHGPEQLFRLVVDRVVELIWEVASPGASIGLLIYGCTQVLSVRLTIGDRDYVPCLSDNAARPAGQRWPIAPHFQNPSRTDRVLDLLEEPLETLTYSTQAIPLCLPRL